MLKIRLMAILLGIFCIFTFNAGAATLTYNTNMGLIGDKGFSPSEVNRFFQVDEFSLYDIPQFDPALGTLNAAILSISGPSDFYMELSADYVPNPLQDHWMDIDGGFTISANVPSSSTFAFQSFSYYTSCDGSGGEPCSAIGFFNDDVSILSLFTDDGATPTNELASFIGNGDLDGISVGLYLWLDSFNYHNLENPTVYLEDNFYDGLVAVEYDYTPVPIPGALWLLGSGLFGLIAVRRRQG